MAEPVVRTVRLTTGRLVQVRTEHSRVVLDLNDGSGTELSFKSQDALAVGRALRYASYDAGSQ